MTRDASKRLVSAIQMSPVTESQLASGSDGIVDHQPSASNTTFAAVRFEHKEYNVTNYFQKFWIVPGIIPLCCTLDQKLELEAEEAHLVTTTCCSTETQRRPYGELQAVDHIRCLGCCSCFKFADTPCAPRVEINQRVGSAEVDAMCPHRLCPQCFCAGDLVEEIVKELKTRMKARGDTGQIKRAEQLLGEIQILKAQAQNTDAKLNAILKHLNIEAPPPTASAVTQQPV